MELLISILLATGLAAAPAAPPSQESGDVVASTDRMPPRELDGRLRLSANFPNELHRLYGAERAARGEWDDALRQFTEAARHADKYSQHRISLMYWHGAGELKRDPALAYAWADLAAERMYPGFLVLREKMWLELTDAERERALREGAVLYERYGDKVAKPRLAAAIARQNSQVTGSRTGYVDGRLSAYSAGPGATSIDDNSTGTDLRPMYEAWRLDPERYWAVEDAIWKDGSVDIGKAVKTDGEAAPAEK
ncbi:MAG TPA: hypothetical protein VGD42_17080 [Lysobacter sp.]